MKSNSGSALKANSRSDVKTNIGSVTKTRGGEAVKAKVHFIEDYHPLEKRKGHPRQKAADNDVESANFILYRYLNEIHKIPMIERAREAQLARLARDGDLEARNQLVLANLRFVVTVTRKYQSYGLSMMDLINEGNMGLIKAAERFNPDRGFHFISYAVWWIKQSVLYAIRQKSHLIRLPVNRTTELRRLGEAEISADLMHSTSAGMHSLAGMLDMKVKDLNHLVTMSRDLLSLDAPMGEGEDFSLGENIPDTSSNNQESSMEKDELREYIRTCLDHLSEQEKGVLRMRFGLEGTVVRSLQKIGKTLNLSKERIRQIEKKAIRKMRTCQCSQLMSAYL